jgi:hypothetical protein
MERLIRFLNALDRDVCIVVSPEPRRSKGGTLRVAQQARRPMRARGDECARGCEL